MVLAALVLKHNLSGDGFSPLKRPSATPHSCLLERCGEYWVWILRLVDVADLSSLFALECRSMFSRPKVLCWITKAIAPPWLLTSASFPAAVSTGCYHGTRGHFFFFTLSVWKGELPKQDKYFGHGLPCLSRTNIPTPLPEAERMAK